MTMKVPKVQGKCRVDAGQYCQEIVLEFSNSAIRPVSAMHIWWDELEFGILFEGDGFFASQAGLDVEDLEVNQKTPGCQACHNGILGSNVMAVALGLECLLEGKIAIRVKGNHDVLVPQACSDWKAASVIHVQLAEGVHRDKDLIGWHICRTWDSGKQCWRCQWCGLFGLG